MDASPSTSVTASPPGRQTLDLTIYLASLVSEVRAIDPILEPVRLITARLQQSDAIPPDDQRTLDQVCQQLKQYLTTQEKVRAFTPEQLEEHIADFTHGARHRSLRRALLTAAIITVVLILAVVALPLPLTAAARGLTASSVFFMMVHLAAAWLFISALRTFAPNLRKAYTFIASGVGILGLSQIIQPAVQVLELQSTPYNTLLSVLPLIPSYLLMYVGIRRFAQVIGRQSLLLEPLALGICVAMAIPLGILLPHVNAVASERLLDVIFVLQLINISVVIVCTVLLGRILGPLTRLYARPVRLLLLFAIISIGIGVYMCIANALTGGVPTQPMLIPLIIAIVVNGFILLRAGYDFNRASMR